MSATETKPIYYEDLVRLGHLSEDYVSRLADRGLGVQIIIFNPNGELFLRNDPEGGSRKEAHFYMTSQVGVGDDGCTQGFMLLGDENPERLNGSGGGVGHGETLRVASLREIKEELELPFELEGELTLLTQFPLLASYQEKGGEAYLIGVLMVMYIFTNEETKFLRANPDKGWFDNAEVMYMVAKGRTGNYIFRPTFRTALIAYGMISEEPDGAVEWINFVNGGIVLGAQTLAEEAGLPLQVGPFPVPQLIYGPNGKTEEE